MSVLNADIRPFKFYAEELHKCTNIRKYTFCSLYRCMHFVLTKRKEMFPKLTEHLLSHFPICTPSICTLYASLLLHKEGPKGTGTL